jgi:hypothetical protein
MQMFIAEVCGLHYGERRCGTRMSSGALLTESPGIQRPAISIVDVTVDRKVHSMLIL